MAKYKKVRCGIVSVPIGVVKSRLLSFSRRKFNKGKSIPFVGIPMLLWPKARPSSLG